MLIKCNNEYKEKIKEYIGNEYHKCLYLYLDLIEYGCETPNINFWIQMENNEIIAVILKYYTGMHVFSKDSNCKLEEISNIILETKPTMICGEKHIISNIYNLVKNEEYKVEYGWIRKLNNNNLSKYEEVELAEEHDFLEIAKLICEDTDMGVSYNLDKLKQQIYERNLQKYTRNYVVRNDGKVVSHAATGAENEKMAIMTHVITAPEHRGKKLAFKVCSNLCKDLIEENKEIFLINYLEKSTGLYDKLGFEISCEWGKIFLDLNK